VRRAALALVLTACAAGQPRIATGPVVSDAEVRAVMRRALEADAASESADSLYSLGATVVANGRARISPPRFAGVARGGVLSIQTLVVEMSPTVAWGTARYRYATREGAMESGEGTFVLKLESRGWRIVHAHSSVALPWEATR